MNILFVCTENTCRSPMAAGLMDKIAGENDLDVRIESAGIFASDGKSASDEAIEVMREKYNIDISGHKSQRISSELIENSDVILTMTDGHKMLLKNLAPSKVYTLLEYAGSEGSISDPYGGDTEEYEQTAREIYDALVDIAEKIYDESDREET